VVVIDQFYKKNISIMAKKNNCEPNQWKIYGRHLEKDDSAELKSNDDVKFGDIVIEEQLSNLTMGKRPPKPRERSQVGLPDPEKENPQNQFGLPISANLAIQLITQAYTKASDAAKTLHAIEILDDNKKKYYQQFSYLKDLLSFNYGVTFDKTILLKILGQPNCEGLRCYLCKRPDEYKSQIDDQDSHFSLVLVGVDSQGFDLNYDVIKEVTANVTTKSMVAEYGYPPTGKSLELKDKVKNKHYTLLNHAVPGQQ
jgi:hypothetical protein